MRLLSFAVFAFAVAAFEIGFRNPDTMIFLLAGAALACALTTFASQKLSSFLKIFEAVFAIETIVFGLAYFVDRLGYWPKDYENYTLPDSLPLAVALFGVFVYAISFVPVVKKMTAIADPYFDAATPTTAKIGGIFSFDAAQNRLAVASLVFLIIINQVEVALDVRLSYFRADFGNALNKLNQPEFWRQLLFVFVPVVAALVASYTIEYVVTSTFVIRWRRWLTANYTARWLGNSAHYKMLLAGSTTDNPDQRISEDIYKFIDGAGTGTGIYGYSVIALQNLTSLVSFSLVLWSLSSGFTIPGLSIIIPGVLFWVALAYTSLGTLFTHLIGRTLVKLNFEQQRREANFRFGLARAREFSEQIALLKGEDNETAAAVAKFGDVYNNYMRIVHVRKWLTTFIRSYEQAAVLIPYVVAAPFYFLGKITFGALGQIASAFNSVNGSLNFFVTYYTGLAEFRATLDRLTSFDDSIARANLLKTAAPNIALAPSPSPDLQVNAAIGLPNGAALARIDNLTLNAREPTLLAGPSGSGKSTLFRAIAGIWPFGNGKILEPAASLMVVPQRPYLSIGPLRAALAYPNAPEAYSDAALRDALTACGLDALREKLDESDNWQMRLSGGEQQRLAIARAILANPDWLFLDEATSALDEASEAQVYKAIAQKLPKTTLVSIGHRSTLEAFHSRKITLQPQQGGPATVS